MFGQRTDLVLIQAAPQDESRFVSGKPRTQILEKPERRRFNSSNIKRQYHTLSYRVMWVRLVGSNFWWTLGCRLST